MKKLKLLYYLLFLIVLFCFIIFKLSNVSKEITSEDKIYIQKIQDKCHLKLTAKPKDFKAEIDQIFMVQDSILKYFPVSKKNVGISKNKTREPKDLWENHELLCYDRSRTMEKIFINLGYEVRHVFLITDTLKKNNGFNLFISKRKGLVSHAMFEIKLKKGWVLVGTNEKWISVDVNFNAYSAKLLNDKYKIKFIVQNKNFERIFLSNGFYFIYGLYSRHGRFFPPFNFLPDINYKGFLYNIF